MSVREVTLLRRAGRLEEALAMAEADLKEKNDEWAQSSLFWVLYDYCGKELTPTGNVSKALDLLQRMQTLLPSMKDDEGRGREQYGWTIHKLLKTHQRTLTSQQTQNQRTLTSQQTRKLLLGYLGCGNKRPSNLHSAILVFALHYSKNDLDFNFLKFFQMWGCDQFRKEDWQKGTSPDGKTYPSNAAQVAAACFDLLKAKDTRDEEDVRMVARLYEALKERRELGDWDGRKMAMLDAWSGNKEKAIQQYKKALMEQLSDKYYMWAELAEYVDDLPTKIGLLLKAKSLEKNEDFLGNIHLALAEAWLAERRPDKAKQELGLYAAHRQEKKRKISEEYVRLCALAEATVVNSGPQRPEHDYLSAAVAYVYADCPQCDFVLVRKWESNGVKYCTLADGKARPFHVKAKKFPVCARGAIGDVFRFRYLLEENANATSYADRVKIRPLMAEKSERAQWALLPATYGFVEYINTEKNVAHIATCDSTQLYYKLDDMRLSQGDFAVFHTYPDYSPTGIQTRITGLSSCTKAQALTHFPNKTGVVDDVNHTKSLFHLSFIGKLTGVAIHFGETDERPQIGDFMTYTYCVRKGKDGKTHPVMLDVHPAADAVPGLQKTMFGNLRIVHARQEDGPATIRCGFIEDCYVHRRLLAEHGITADCPVSAKAVRGSDGQWKVYFIELHNV